MKISKKELIRDIISFIVVIVLVIVLNNFITNNLKILFLSFLFFFINYIIILFHERKYSSNFPYKPYKSKDKSGKRILTGLLAGGHYIFFIGSYNRKKYNTKAWYPETIECVFGNISQVIIFLAYVLISIKLFEIELYYFLAFAIIPIVT